MTSRSGIGYDVHRFVEGRRLVLGGVEIAHPRGLDGHSDADVLVHALVDAVLGAAALGDIGHHFPPSDPTWRNADSRMFLTHAAHLVRNAGFEIVNLDATVIAEEPRLVPHVEAIRRAIADTVNLPITAVSVKATTNEGMGFVGRGEGIAALAIATLQSPPEASSG
jgi:2-C-methyl-D-erythritol 2,4-cyclodiphosphate synthase